MIIGTDRELTESQITGGCSTCDVQWGSLALAHCKGDTGHSGCGRSFSSDSAFDLHRRGGVCRDPQAIVKKSGEHYLKWDEVKQWWGFPGDRPEID